MPPSSKPCQIRAQDDQLKLEENLPSWKLHLNPICEDPEVGQTLSELLLCFPKTLHVTLNLFLKSYLVLRNPNFCFVTYNKYQSLFLALFSKIIAQQQGSVASQNHNRNVFMLSSAVSFSNCGIQFTLIIKGFLLFIGTFLSLGGFPSRLELKFH